ncbi:hypothetical protein J8F10_19285 [Gemmata sp. G18]|uniref:Uncharacterized protein n=1 Tax=Gemmata palustris TaxID=2822762 RepID=A0ABS5BVW7_9BACT|nr:hypothetical protein [Gemmata palustris]MBP3957395.1 hypothetical protein [Gemmata palustris]
MSSTNPSPQDPVVKLAPKEPGAPAHDDHDLSGPPSAETIKRGYEEDKYDTKTVLSVPLLVVLFFVLAFGTVTVLFSVYSKPIVDPNAHPQAKARNEADINTRMGRIHRGGEVDQPRLEPLRMRSGDSRAITRPELPTGNSPEIHPEDLIPNEKRFPELYATNKEKVGLDKTMALGNDALKTLFKSSAPPLSEEASRFVPSGSNAGRGAEGSQAAAPKAPETKQPAPAPKENKK